VEWTLLRSLYHLVGVSGANGAELDVGEDDLRVGALRFDIGGGAGGCGASSAGNTRGRSRLGKRVVAIEPEHLGRMVIPDTEDQNHSLGEGLTHGRETTLLREGVGIAEGGLLLRAEGIGDLVGSSDARDVGHGVLDDLSVLDVQALDGGECAGSAVVAGDELGDNGELGAGIDGHALAVEVGDTHSV